MNYKSTWTIFPYSDSVPGLGRVTCMIAATCPLPLTSPAPSPLLDTLLSEAGQPRHVVLLVSSLTQPPVRQQGQAPHYSYTWKTTGKMKCFQRRWNGALVYWRVYLRGSEMTSLQVAQSEVSDLLLWGQAENHPPPRHHWEQPTSCQAGWHPRWWLAPLCSSSGIFSVWFHFLTRICSVNSNFKSMLCSVCSLFKFRILLTAS